MGIYIIAGNKIKLKILVTLIICLNSIVKHTQNFLPFSLKTASAMMTLVHISALVTWEKPAILMFKAAYG